MHEPSTSANTVAIAKQIGNSYVTCPKCKNQCDYHSDDSSHYKGDSDIDYHEEIEAETKHKKPLPKGPQTSTSTGEIVTPFTFWSLFFDESILAHIIDSTNKKLKNVSKKYKNTTKMNLSPLCMDELHAFLGLLIYSAVFKTNEENVDALFATDGTAYEIFKLVMARKRFILLLKYLCFDSPKPEGNEWSSHEEIIAPVSYVFKKFVENCKTNLTPGPIVKTEDIYFSAKNKLSAKHWNPSAYGIKIQFVYDVETNYCYNGHLCTKECEGQGHDILIEDGIVKKNPKEDEESLNTFEKARTLDDIYFRRTVLLTCYRPNTRMWHIRVLYHLLDTSALNSFILYQKNTEDDDSIETFFKDLARCLVLNQLLKRATLTWLPFDYRLSIRRVLGNDAPPSEVPTAAVDRESSDPSQNKRKTCRMCPPSKKRKTKYFCLDCKIPICLQCSQMVCTTCAENFTGV